MKHPCRLSSGGSRSSPCCWGATGSTLNYFLVCIVTYLHWRYSSGSVESCGGLVLQRAIKSLWVIEVRQVLFLTLWMLFQGVRLLLHFGPDILLRTGWVFFPLSILQKSWDKFSALFWFLYFRLRGRSSTKGLWELWSTRGMSSVAQGWQQQCSLMFDCSRCAVQTTVCVAVLHSAVGSSRV